MKRRFATRRQLLRGAGGFTLALPLLPSLLPRGVEAKGGAAIPPRFVSISTGHGGVWPEHMHPAQSTLTETMNYGGHEIRRGDLSLTESGGRAQISEVVSGDANVLTPALAQKMNVIRGLDVPFYIGHNLGAHLGNWAANNADGEDGAQAQAFPTPTIDQVMAESRNFYADLSSIKTRTMVIGHNHSFRWTNETQESVTPLSPEESSLALFDLIFDPPDEEEEERIRPPIVDRVLENYHSLRQSNRRLSANDRQRLDEHIARVDELQRRLQVTLSCGDVPTPTQEAAQLREEPSYYVNPELNAEYWSLFNDVVVTAFSCGSSRLAVMGVIDIFSDFAGEWHQDVAHQAHLPDGERQGVLSQAHQETFEGVMLDLIRKLDDVEDGDGGTLLDNTLVQWSQESGPMTHESIDSCIVTAGSAGGCMRTGQYLDYRNRDVWVEEDFFPMNTGLLLQQYFASTLQLLGVPPEEYELEPGGGYPRLFSTRDQLYPASIQNVRGDILPWLEA